MLFFFQAEDGIRGLTVTGVQTCALPIYSRSRELARASIRLATLAQAMSNTSDTAPRTTRIVRCAPPTTCRSEERRVGKEGRFGWPVNQEIEKAATFADV